MSLIRVTAPISAWGEIIDENRSPFSEDDTKNILADVERMLPTDRYSTDMTERQWELVTPVARAFGVADKFSFERLD